MPILEEDVTDDMLFQQDGAPPHFQKEVTDFLNRKFQERGGPVSWPPRSPDFTPLDFFILGVHQVRCLRATIGCHFAGTFYKVKICSGYSYPRLV
jgi:hypothetical protein